MAEQTILSLFRRFDRGQLPGEMQDGINRIVAAIEAAGGQGKGELTLKLKIGCDAPGSYEIEPDITLKLPKPKRAKTRAFFNETTQSLDDRDPRQPVFGEVVSADRSNGAAYLHDNQA